MAPTTALFMTFQGGGAGRDLHWVHRPTQPEPAMNKEKSQAFMLKVVSDLATSLAVALVHVGDRVGLFKAWPAPGR